MDVFDINGNLLKEYDLSAGKIVSSIKIVHHEAIPPVEEISHWDEKRHPNGGISRRKIIEREAAPGKGAWDEEITIYTYVPYTEEELEKIETEKNVHSIEDRLAALETENAQLKEALELLLSGEVQ